MAASPKIVPPLSPSTPKILLEIPVSLIQALERLNKEIVYVRATSEIAELSSPAGETKLKYMSPHDFKNADYSDRSILVEKKRVFLAPEWMKWPKRRKVNRTVYEPGQDRITKDGNLNTWFPSPNKPIKSDVSLFLHYIDHLFASDPTYKPWFMRWLAYPVQNLGAKLHTSSVFWSTQTGTGKSTLSYIMKEIYGQHNCSLLSENDLDASFNGWAVGKVWVEVDEMQGGPRARRRAETLKSFSTRHTIPIDLKYQNRYEIRDTINYYYTSNHIESLYLDAQDRRFFVHNVGDTKLSEEFFRQEFGPWLKAGGFSAVHYYLLNDIDLSTPVLGGNPYSTEPAPFSPGAAAPHTKSRQAVIEAGYDDVEAWIKELLDCPPNVLGEDEGRTLFTANELYKIYRGQYPEIKTSLQTFSHKLNQQHMQVNEGKQIRVGVTRLRLYSVTPAVTPVTLSQLKETLSRERGEVCDTSE